MGHTGPVTGLLHLYHWLQKLRISSFRCIPGIQEHLTYINKYIYVEKMLSYFYHIYKVFYSTSFTEKGVIILNSTVLRRGAYGYRARQLCRTATVHVENNETPFLGNRRRITLNWIFLRKTS